MSMKFELKTVNIDGKPLIELHYTLPDGNQGVRRCYSRSDALGWMKEYLMIYFQPEKETYQTHTLPKYVKRFFESLPITMEREGDKYFKFKTSNKVVVIRADHASAARRRVAEFVKKKGQ